MRPGSKWKLLHSPTDHSLPSVVPWTQFHANIVDCDAASMGVIGAQVAIRVVEILR